MLPLSPSLPLIPLNIPPSPTDIQGYVHNVDTTLGNDLGHWNSQARQVDVRFNQIMGNSNLNANGPVKESGSSNHTSDLDSMSPDQMKQEIQALRRRNLRLRNELTAWQMRAEFAEKASTLMAEKLESLGSPFSPSTEEEMSEQMSIAIDEHLKI